MNPNADMLRAAFWEALKRCDNDDRIHAMDMPCFSRTGQDTLVDGYLPEELWEHMKAALSETSGHDPPTWGGIRSIYGSP